MSPIQTTCRQTCRSKHRQTIQSLVYAFISTTTVQPTQQPYSHSVQPYRYIFLHSYTVASYTKIFRAVGHHQAQIQDHAQQQPNQPNVLNMVRYIKALHSAVWVQLALIICYVPCFTLIILCEVRCPNDIRIEGIAIVLVFLNSTLNPFLYCWKISEVRQAVKQTIRQAISCAQVDLF